MIEDEKGNKNIPNFVTFTNDGEILIGEAAKRQRFKNAKNTIYNINSFLGKKFEDVIIQRNLKQFPFKVVNKTNLPIFEIEIKNGEKKLYSPEEIASFILKKAKKNAERAFPEREIKHFIFSVPKNFDDFQRESLKNSARLAGMNPARLILHPLSICFSNNLQALNEKFFLVFHLGSNLMETSILNVDEGIFEFFSSEFEENVGGDSIDQKNFEYFLDVFKKNTGKDASTNISSVETLMLEAENSKKRLSFENDYEIKIIDLFEGENFFLKIDRTKFEELNRDLFHKIVLQIDKSLNTANLTKDQIEYIIFSGASTLIPKIKDIFLDYFGNINFIQNNSLNGCQFLTLFFFFIFNFFFILGIVQGAAIVGEILTRKDETLYQPSLSFVTLSVETYGGIMVPMIHRNSFIPLLKKRNFTTYKDNQENVSIKVYAGERPLSKYNRLLTQIELKGINIAPQGITQIEVIFDLDDNQDLFIIAREIGKKNEIFKKIKFDDYLIDKREETFSKMIEEAELNAEVDDKDIKKIRSQISLLNNNFDVLKEN
jgi:endoplasmic reticulum chaperone BiP